MALSFILEQKVLRPCRLRPLKLEVIILLVVHLVGGVVIVHVELAENLLLTLEVFRVFLAFVELVLL